MELAGRSRSATELYEKYVDKRRCSRAGYYKALTCLKKKEVILEKDRMLSINKIWLADSYDFFRKLVRQKTTPSYLAERIALLSEGDRLSYTFHSMSEIDIFILNLLYDLLLLKIDRQALILEAHEFFILMNDVRTKRILNELSTVGHSVWLLIESDAPIDVEIAKKMVPKSAIAYVSGKESKDTAKIVHVVGDVCIELRLNKLMSAAVDKLYSSNEAVTEDFVEDLKNIVDRKQRHEILVYRSKQKTDQVRNKFKKHFPF